MFTLEIQQFIKDHITRRQNSLFASDLAINQPKLSDSIDGRSVLVIGGAGTIGSSFIKALLKFSPRKLFVIDTNENGLTELTRDLRSSYNLNIPREYKTYPINFGDSVFENILRKEGPFEIIANFAAHKHVRSEKDHYSIAAMVENNAIRAKRLLDQLITVQPERFFCVSTDKATNPVNVMGASKKLMEEVIMSYADELPITTARFANVAFSQGSLLDGFLYRLQKRQPFSSPSDVRRYFVSPEESGQICLLACILGDSKDIFFPKLKEEQMEYFSNIGTALLRTLGYKPDYCSSEEEARQKAALINGNTKEWPVYYFDTDTTGEKLYEEFYAEEEEIDWNRFEALGIIKGNAYKSRQEIIETFDRLSVLLASHQVTKASIIELFESAIPNFHHIEKGKNLDQKM